MTVARLVCGINRLAQFKSNVRETWRVILVSEADIFLSESLRILAERLSQSENGLLLRQICYYSPPEEVGVFSTEIKHLQSLVFAHGFGHKKRAPIHPRCRANRRSMYITIFNFICYNSMVFKTSAFFD